MLRRSVLSLLVLAAAGGSTLLQAREGPPLAGIDQVRLGVSDRARSLDFHAALFGAVLREETSTGSIALQLGESILLLQAAAEPAVLEHGFAVETPIPALQAVLQDLGIRVQNQADGSLLVEDRDGVRTRLGAALPWGQLAASALSVAGGRPVFQPLLIDEIAINVTNMQVDSMFYARLLGQTSNAVAGSQFFSIGNHARLRLIQTAVGQPAGFNYFSVLVANTDMDAAAEAVFGAGGIVESFLPNGFSFWDPDGLRVFVRTAPQVLNSPSARP
jgi:catechol 2,3-dioxygenase-like lactoylglutathione lyase family enzyme